jgi:hypothetical protein
MAANLFDYGFLVLNILQLSPVRAIAVEHLLERELEREN